MAKQMYEEERIRAIAAKIKKYDPSWFNGITTAEMPKGIERVYEIGYADGEKNGYSEGRNASNTAIKNSSYEQGYNDGYDKGYGTGFGAGERLTKLPELTYPGTAEDLVVGTQLIDGHGNLVEGALEPVPMLGILVSGRPYSVDTAGGKEIWYETTYPGPRAYIADATNVVVTSVARNFGNAPASVVPVGYTFTSEAGLRVGGAAPMRTSADLDLERLSTFDLGLTVPSGYYGDGVTRVIDVEPYYDEGYDKGLAEGVEKVKTEEARTSNDITQQDNIVFVPSGYYAEDTDMEINTDQYYDQGYEAGFTAGAESVGSYEDGNGVKY